MVLLMMFVISILSIEKLDREPVAAAALLTELLKKNIYGRYSKALRLEAWRSMKNLDGSKIWIILKNN